jgi:PAS domain S-box-containing protein
MALDPSRDDIHLVASIAAAFGTAEERVQRTERQLIDAALAVNEASTLEEALEALAGSARSIVVADRVTILEWDADFQGATIAATAGEAVARGTRVPSTPVASRLVARDEPFVVGEEQLAGLPPELLRRARAVGTILCIPLNFPGVPTVSFQASWDRPVTSDVCELAISKLRLLGRLTRVAFRSEAERSRAREDARLRTVLEAVPDGLVVRTNTEAIVNSAARELLAVSDDPPVEIELRELDGTEVPADATPLRRAMRTGEPQSYVLRVCRYDGVERIHEGRIAPVVDENGDVFATVTAFRDVTQAHEERFVTEQFLERLFEALPIGVAIVDPTTFELRRANPSFLELIGYDLDELVGARPPYPWWAEAYEMPDVGDHEVIRYERLFRRKNGELVPVELALNPVPDADGRPNALVILISDQSERRDFEQRLVQSGKLASIGELAAGVAHEINNPLFAILGLVEFLLLDAEQGTKSHERLELIQGTALEIKEIVRALLDFARERSDERAVISLTDVAAQTVELMRRTSAAKQVEIVERHADAVVPVDASANQLKQIFVNLISNAKQAMKDGGGTITVEVGRDGDVAWAEVRDTGPGIPAEVVGRIFEPFFTTRRDLGGTGLGLSVSFGIAQAHGGSLVVDSSPGEGTAFRLRLPIAEGAA